MSDLRRIKSVEPWHGHQLVVVWDDGTVRTIDLAADIARGGVFAALRDSKVFDQVRLDPRRRIVQWLNPDGSTLVDIDADALFVLGEQQHTGSFVQRLFQWWRESQRHPAGQP